MASLPTPLFIPAVPRRRGYFELVAIVAVQSFGNQMAVSFWLVFLIREPQSLPFHEAMLVWLLTFLVAVLGVLALARRRAIRSTPAMIVGLSFAVFGHVVFALLPAFVTIAVASIAFGLYLPGFWLPMNVLLVRETSAANRAGRMAGVTATFTIVAVVAPAFGGVLAEFLGFRALFLLSASVVGANILLVRALAQRDETFAFGLALRRVGLRTSLAFGGQGAVEGLFVAAAPLAAFLYTRAPIELGLLFAFFSFAAGATTLALGRLSDRRRSRRPFLLVGPLLAVPAAWVTAISSDLGTFALAVGWLSMATGIAPSFLFTTIVDRMEDAVAEVSASREFLLNAGRCLSLGIGLAALVYGGDVSLLFLLMIPPVILQALAK